MINIKKKINIRYVNNSFLINSLDEYSLFNTLDKLSKLLINYFHDNKEIMISINLFNKKNIQNYVNNFVIFLSKYFQIYQLKNVFLIANELIYFTKEKNKYNNLIHIYYDSDNSLLIVEFDCQSNFKLENIYNDLISDTKINNNFNNNLPSNIINLDFQTIVNDFLSSEIINNNFKNLKERYKAEIKLIVKNSKYKEIINNLTNNYNAKINSFIHNRHFVNDAIFIFEKNLNLSLSIRTNKKFLKLDKNTIILLYLNFLLEELKRNKFNLNNYSVCISNDADMRIIKLLNHYHVNYYYDKHSNINFSNLLFSYDNKKVNSFPATVKYDNIFYFYLCLIWMLNIYKNRNNLLLFKYKQVINLYGIYKTIVKKINLKNIDINIFKSKLINKLENYKKSIDFKSYILINKLENYKFYLANIQTNENDNILLFYDYITNKINIKFNLCKEKKYQIFNWKLNYLKYKKIIKKIIN
ncbi:hypothetical protein VBM87_02365 [Mycoplasma sp. 744]|uniref:MAG5620 family putative phospho-sugar mutase n=2 Tax=unclassified Mycoplasma TaxID=2683645 RepID=UPI002B1D0836|nr:hypothetical protein [Mycoplasma sp. 744]MEA4115615.1 hypothetical protein [Mycoplasma sp. 744]